MQTAKPHILDATLKLVRELEQVLGVDQELRRCLEEATTASYCSVRRLIFRVLGAFGNKLETCSSSQLFAVAKPFSKVRSLLQTSTCQVD